MKYPHRLNLRIDDELYRALVKAAKEKDMNISEAAREILQKAIAQRETDAIIDFFIKACLEDPEIKALVEKKFRGKA